MVRGNPPGRRKVGRMTTTTTNHKFGDRREDGFTFLHYEKRNGRLREKWASPAAFENYQAYQRRYQKNRRALKCTPQA